ncbi:helix-turn-helix transcriptional regulator [Thalassoroseus pseudoceratinae]|uniref:helix-turn-helix transcriptional regulator n=1 Tax=Thalassoroseus pseudoceratinae TaxID=2713176 RepID=UPI00141FD45D|nr:helix-turn-helix domain-containing protein [Thalassoroseus pseudoceratinae]
MSGSPLRVVRADDPHGETDTTDTDSPHAPAADPAGDDKPSEPTAPPLTLTQEELARELRVDVRSIRRWNNAGKLPRPINLGTRAPRWLRETIVRWLASAHRTGELPDRKEWEALEAQRNDRLARRPSR